MTALAGVANLALAFVYFTIGSLIAVDLGKAIKQRGWSHFGVSWLAIMYTCGLHHLVHATHVLGEGRVTSSLDLAATVTGLPVGLAWSWLRIEEVRGGRGDRFVLGTPLGLRIAATGLLGSMAAIVVATIVRYGSDLRFDSRLLPNALITLLYLGIGVLLWRGQHRNRVYLGGWSVSGMSLMMIFPTCGLMHWVYVWVAAAGRFDPDWHGLWADWLSVPAALYFFWAVAGMERGTLRDWNPKFESITDLSPVADDAAPVPQDA